ncbi:DNA internalization-related competence protein ComEC/Rec2 [Dissulfurispira thermophila]|uniref:DNA internalization-related competence protein ComEC/Rec2 n=1 Tax=Dissulfurispira thermophila TaxID=2715679 RepID=A0A7G1H3E6_9BACT|nr:DNA internalization-related competence protein ComEC/Rec2 [Dissulfurispira thermophila]BCB97238.1 DNA internalization-related competence protein ComEC/Rec2 [Dissulfurispira thermophila]
MSFLKFRKQTGYHIFIIAIIAVSGFYYAKMRYVPQLSPSNIAGETIQLQGIVASDVQETTIFNADYSGFSYRIKVKSPENLKEIRLISNEPLQKGEPKSQRFFGAERDKVYDIKAQIPKDAYSLNPGVAYSLLTGYAIEVKEIGSNQTGFFERLRMRLDGFMKGNLSPESASFLMSIITGERSLISKNTRDAFNATGLAHILSISGTHFGLLWLVLFNFFRFFVKILPHNVLVRLTLYITPSQIAAVLSIPFMIAYLGISDMSIPSIRAFIMITLFLFSLLIYRKGFWLNTLLFAAIVIILIQPDSILDLSFQLSFIAVLCIGLVAEQKDRTAAERQALDARRLSLGARRMVRYCSSALKISLAASIGTAPLVAYYFHYVSLISPITNLMITPFIGFIILPLSILSSFVFLISGVFPLSRFIGVITNFVLDVIKHIAQWNFVDIKIPAFPFILLIMFYIGVLVYVIVKMQNRQIGSPKSRRLFGTGMAEILPIAIPIGIAIVPIVFYTGIKLLEPSGISITYLDVGQGDSAVVELPDKKTIVIDTGRKGFQTGEFLKYRGIKNVEAIILSHGQSDHAGGIRRLLRDFKVREVWDNSRLIYPDDFFDYINEATIHRKLQRGDIIEGEGYKITVLHPYDGFYTMHSTGNEENNDCIVLRIQGYRNSFLFTGDIGEEAEEDLLYLGEYLKSNVMKVPHHGSRSSASEMFFKAVSPEIAVISVGRKNTYGHPHVETLDMLFDARVYRTDVDGAIGIHESSDGRIRVKTWRDFQFVEAKTLSDELMNVKRLFWVW